MHHPCCCQPTSFYGSAGLVVGSGSSGGEGPGTGFWICGCNDVPQAELPQLLDVELIEVHEFNPSNCGECEDLEAVYRVTFTRDLVDSAGLALPLRNFAAAWWLLEGDFACDLDRALFDIVCPQSSLFTLYDSADPVNRRMTFSAFTLDGGPCAYQHEPLARLSRNYAGGGLGSTIPCSTDWIVGGNPIVHQVLA